MMDSLWGGAQWGGSHQPSTVGEEVLGEGADPLTSWTQPTPGPLASSQEHLPWLALAPGLPLAPGRQHIISFWLPPSASSGPEIEKDKLISKVRKIRNEEKHTHI